MNRITTALALTAAASLLAVPATAKQLTPVSIDANSIYVDAEKGITYGPEKLIDQMRNEMWIEGEGSAGLGKYISVKFDGEVELAKIRIWAGCFTDKEYWERHNRVEDLEFKFPDFTSERIKLDDKMEAQWITLKEPKTVSSVKIYLRSVHKGTTWNDTAISEIQFFDKAGVEGPVEGAAVTVTSTYGDDADYAGEMAADGWLDTWWINGDGDGKGEVVELDLGATKTLKTFTISTGFDSGTSFFEGSNRVAEVKLEFDGAGSQTFSVVDKIGLQTFSLSPVTTAKVKVVVSKIAKGKSHDDLYIGELRFSE